MPLVLLPTRSTTDVVSSDAPGALKTRCSVVTCNQAGLETRCKVEAEQVWFCGHQLPTNPTTGIGRPHRDSLFLFYSDHTYDNSDLCEREKYSWQPQNIKLQCIGCCRFKTLQHWRYPLLDILCDILC